MIVNLPRSSPCSRSTAATMLRVKSFPAASAGRIARADGAELPGRNEGHKGRVTGPSGGLPSWSGVVAKVGMETLADLRPGLERKWVRTSRF